MKRKVDIIIPVYNGFDETVCCIESVFKTLPLLKTEYEVIIINDGSPNAELSQWLEEQSKLKPFTLLINEKNLGFVATVNKGMSYNKDSDIVLLNSDTEVANNWLDRMVKGAYLSNEIATLTPFSNNAEICSFPRFCRANELPSGMTVEELDAVFRDVVPQENVEVPTGVGFCMYIKRSALKKVGLFDVEEFGRGYGEENDFCMRASRKGMTNVLCLNTFVYHSGGVSFGKEKAERVQNAMQTLDRLYPEYHEKIHEHIKEDPAREWRMRVDLEILKKKIKNKPGILAITHNLGGGTEKHIQELADHVRNQAHVFVLRAEEDNKVSFSLEAGDNAPNFLFKLPMDYDRLKELCLSFNISRIHCHHIMRVDPIVWALLNDLNVKLDVTLHDYYFINANPTITDPDGEFCEEPFARDERCGLRYEIPGHAPASFWRHNQHAFLKRADRIFSPSQWTADFYNAYFPDVTITVANHPDWEQDQPYPAVIVKPLKASEKLRIAVLGAVSKEKGADILDACSRLSHRNPKIEFHLIGYAYRPLDPALHMTGPYQDGELSTLIDEIDPHLIWFPCRWPETYSYTLSTSIAMGLPIIGPDIGSFPERLKGRPFSLVERWSTTPEKWMDLFEKVRKEWFLTIGDDDAAVKHPWRPHAPSAFRYKFDYTRGEKRDHGMNKIDNLFIARYMPKGVAEYLEDGNIPLTTKEKLLVLLLQIRSNPLMYKIIRMLPFQFLQNVKRKLSSRPVHEVINQHNQQGGGRMSIVRLLSND